MRRSFTRSLTLAMTSVSAVALFASPSFAQVAPAPAPIEDLPEIEAEDVPVTDAEVTDAEGRPVSEDEGTIVITGSRIRHDTYNTDSPVELITREDAILAGSRSTAEVLQSSAVTSGTAQINGTFLGFVSEGGPAANTVGLRGLGAARTLILLNGRRLAPAGAGPELVAADLNVLPTNIVQRIEVLREGASSIYGSDAIAGVINVITDTAVDGLTFDFYTNQPIEHGGGGRTYRTSAVWGKIFDRGHITGSVEYRQTSGLRVGDRKEFTCPTDLFTNRATGEPFGQLDAEDPTKVRCFPFQDTPIGTAQNYMLGFNFTTGRVNRFSYVDADINTLINVNNFNIRPNASSRQLDEHVLSPIKTLTGYLNGAYEIEALGNGELYGEALFTRRKSHQDYSSQISIDPNQLGSEIYGGTYAGFPLSDFGYPTSPFFPISAADIGQNFLRVFIVPPILQNKQKIGFLRTNGGLRGELGIRDWEYDANLQYSHTNSHYSVQGIDTRRFRASLDTVIAPSGTPADLITVALPGQEGFGGSYTCASNVSGGAFIAGSNCVPINIFDPQVLLGNIPGNVFNYLYQDHQGQTKFDQTTLSFVVNGSLFDMPAGPFQFALGIDRRYDKIKDTPSEAAQTGNLYNYSSAGITKGKDHVTEVYGEINVPFLKDKPFADELSASGSLRYTNYKSYGTGWTYHVGAQWAPINEIRFRGNYGTSFRAPNLFEQFVADQSGFYGAGADPCDDFGAVFSPGDPVYDNCLAELTPILGANAVNFVASGGPQVFTRGGAGNLKAEKSKSYGFGTILNAPAEFADLSFAVDYFHIKVRDQVSLLNTTILSRCYESEEFRAGNIYCDFIAPRDDVQGNLTSFLNPYLNIASQEVAGLDFNGRYATRLFNGQFVADLSATRLLSQKFQQFEEEDPVDYNGELGNQGTVGGPKWVADLDLRYTIPGDTNITFRWGIEYVGKMGTPTDPVVIRGVEVDVDLIAEHYVEHGFSVQWKWKDVGQVTMGVNNIFNETPATISGYPTSAGQYPRIGNYFNYSGYDFIGRSGFINVTRSF